MNAPARIKAGCNRSHARRRAAERYGLDLSAESLAAIEATIRGGGPHAVLLRPDHRGKDRGLYAVRLDGAWLPAVFDRATDSLVTFLPARELEHYRHVFEPRPARRPPGVVAASPPEALPPEPDEPPEGAGVAEIAAVLAAVVARIEAAEGMLASLPRPHHLRRELGREIARLNQRRGRLRRARHVALQSALIADPGTPADPTALLWAARGLIIALADRLDWEGITPEQRDLLGAISAFVDLTAHAPETPA